MPSRTTRDCSRCGASYELDVWNLGHEDSDSISCECCGKTILEWRNEVRSYSIARTITRGNLDIKYYDWEKFKDKKLKFTKGDVQIHGILKGLDDSVLAISKEKVTRPWLIQTETEEISLHPDDGWQICTGKDA